MLIYPLNGPCPRITSNPSQERALSHTGLKRLAIGLETALVMDNPKAGPWSWAGPWSCGVFLGTHSPSISVGPCSVKKRSSLIFKMGGASASGSWQKRSKAYGILKISLQERPCSQCGLESSLTWAFRGWI